MTELERVLINRDEITLEDALADYLGVEPDYIFDIL